MTRYRFDLTTFRALLLDVGNVITYDFPAELAYSYFAREELLKRKYDFTLTVGEILGASTSESSPLRQLLSANVWQEVDSIAWGRVLSLWPSLCVPIPGAIETLHILRQHRLAIVANQPPETQSVLESLGIAHLFEEIIFDSTVGVSKPSPAIYHYAARRLRAEPEELVMLGDRLDNDILPAQSLGMTTIWIRQRPVDETIHIPFVSEQWKQHYFSPEGQTSIRRYTSPEAESAARSKGFVVESLSGLFD